MDNGTGNKLNYCVGCKFSTLHKPGTLRCHFATKGFALGKGWARPCHSSYHAGCFRVGPPFRSRLSDDKGLYLTPAMTAFMSLFICECCTVRKTLGRELTHQHSDRGLLALERMRILDMAHHWAPSTMGVYQSKLRVLQRFAADFKVPILSIPKLSAPPTTDAIPIMWAQQYYSLQKRARERFREFDSSDDGLVCYGTTRQLRSAVSVHETWVTMLSNPGQVLLDKGDDRPKLVAGCRATDEMPYTLMSRGMEKRLGRKSRQVAALLDRHIRWIDKYCEDLYIAAMSDGHHDNLVEICMVGCFNLFAWLGWFRGGEVLGINWDDCHITDPTDSASQDLPTGVGAILLQLLEETKTERTFRADVPIAYTTYSGLSPGKWLIRLRVALGKDPNPDTWVGDATPLFCDAAGTRWTSAFYRKTYLIPYLDRQSKEGDTYLQGFSNLADAFWSLHCYRIGGRSHVSVHRPLCARKANIEETNEHGRWKVKRNNETMAEQYRHWTLRHCPLH